MLIVLKHMATVSTEKKRYKIGLIVGKFMPPHQGHLILANFARAQVERLMIVVYTRAADPIPGVLRYGWMKELCPGDIVVEQADKNPLESTDHPDFPGIWASKILEVCPLKPQVVFTSENYGPKLAAALHAELVSDVPQRLTSATEIRRSPFENWEFIPECVRPYFLDGYHRDGTTKSLSE